MTISLRITGKNADGEYWLHLDGNPQKAGLNLGDPAGMIASALLMAATGNPLRPRRCAGTGGAGGRNPVHSGLRRGRRK